MSDPADTMRGRVDKSRARIWILTRMGREALTAGISVGFFVLLVGFSVVSPTPMRQIIEQVDALWMTFSAMLTAIITAVTLVVMFNQLVLSQELGALGDQRERMQDASSFRSDVESYIADNVSPPDPASFLGALLDAVETIADDLEATGQGAVGDDDVNIQSFVESVTDNAESVRDRLEDAQFGTFDVIFAALNFNYSWKIYEARRLLAKHEDSLQTETEEILTEMVTVLELFGPAREHFKTLYFQWELVNLSRRMLYTAIPALLVSTGMMFYIDTGDITGTVLGIDALVLVVCAAVTVTLLPVFLLIAYVLRIVTVAKRTLAMGPFVLREIEQGGEDNDDP